MLIRMSPMTHREPIDIDHPISACLPRPGGYTRFMNTTTKTEIKALVVYSYMPKGATKQRRFVVASGDGPQDIVSTHGTRETAIRAGAKLAAKLLIHLTVEC
jgi:hypothetical protein